MKHNARQRCHRLTDGRSVHAITLTSDTGLEVTISTLGATLQSLLAPDRHGASSDVVLGYDDFNDYLKNDAYFGATLGRYANRIGEGRFFLDGREYRLSTNDGRHTLHGGAIGFSRKLWDIHDVDTGDAPTVVMALSSEDGDDGFPGTLAVRAAFELRGSQLAIRYTAECDAPTIVCLSNHTYFNLNGLAGSTDILGHELTIPADSYVPIDVNSIPTGEIRAVVDTPFDFRTPTAVGMRIRDARETQLVRGRGYDHCWCLGSSPTDEPRLVARLRDPASGRTLEMLSNQPGLQFYSGNFLDGTSVGKQQRMYRQSDGLSLEPQLLPDTPNRPTFGTARLAPGAVYNNHIIYRFSAQ